MKKEDFYNYVFKENPVSGMDIHFFDDSMIRGFFEEENQTDDLKKKNLWRYYPESSWQSLVAQIKIIEDLKSKNLRENDAEIKVLGEKKLSLLELLNGEQVKGLQAFKMAPAFLDKIK